MVNIILINYEKSHYDCRNGFRCILRISKEDTDHYANSFLTIDARHIMSVAGQSRTLEDVYVNNGVRVEWVPLGNLIGGYGAVHCMTQVLSRGKWKNTN